MKLENGNIVIRVYDLIGELRAEDQAVIIDAMACQTEIIDEVMNQVIDGYTTLGSYGPRGFGGNPNATSGIDGARLRIANASSNIASKEIEALAAALKRAEDAQNKGWDAYHELLRKRSFG